MTTMRSLRASAFLFVLLLVAGGCETTSAPERRELLGSWISRDIPGATVRMTLAESARSVDGAGLWVSGGEVRAFSVSGALARGEVALHLDFEARPPLVFQGYFASADSLAGVIAGGDLGQLSASFVREPLFP